MRKQESVDTEERIVLKHRLFYSGMVSLTDQETAANTRTVCYSQFPRSGGMLPTWAAQGNTRVIQKVEQKRDKGNL